MEWTQVLVIIGALGAFFMYGLNRMDVKFNKLEEKVDKCATKAELFAVKTDLKEDISKLTTKTDGLIASMGIIQGQLLPKVVPLEHEKPKKKAKGE